MLRAMRTGLVCFPLLIALPFGCQKAAPKREPIPEASASASAAPSAPPTASRPRGDDLNLAALRTHLKCAAGAKKPTGICGVVDEFEKASAWNLETIRGTDARYFGQTFVNEKGVTRSAFQFLVVKKVPTNDVTPGDLPIRVAFRELDANLKSENKHAPKLLRILEHDDAVTKMNTTAEYIKTYAPASWDSAALTAGASTLLHVEGGAHVREGRGRRLYLIKQSPSSPDSTASDGVFAVLWPLSW